MQKNKAVISILEMTAFLIEVFQKRKQLKGVI